MQVFNDETNNGRTWLFFPRTIYKQFITKVFMIGDFYSLNLSNKKNFIQQTGLYLTMYFFVHMYN